MKSFTDLKDLLRSLPKRKLYLIAGTAAVVIILLLALRFIVYRSVSYVGVVRTAVRGEIEISRDAGGLPTVKAGDWEDAFFALGYLHAQDRLIQIEYYRAIARGTLSEITDERDLPLDRLSRIVGFHRTAEELVEKIGSPYREHLDSYVKGINLVKERMYREITRFSDVPGDPWTPQDVLAVLLMSEWSCGYLNNRELIFPLPDRLGRHALSDALPDKLLFWYSDADQKNVFILKELRKQIQKKINCCSAGFAVFLSKYHTIDGRAKTFFNFDSSLSVYPLWYPVRILIKEVPVEGATMAGTPFIMIGKNRDICFAGFSLRADTQDFFIETTRRDNGKEQFLSGTGWKDFTVREETLGADKEGGRARLPFSVRSTERGPVISDAYSGVYKTDCISMRSAPVGENYIRALFDIPMSDSIKKAGATVVNLGCGPRVFLFSGKESALRVYAGRVPVRAYPDTLFKKDPFIPPAAASIDLSAYQRVEDTDIMIVGDTLFEDVPPPLRDQLLLNDRMRFDRLKAQIQRNDGIDVAYLRTVLGDHYSAAAGEYVPQFIRLLEKVPVTSARLARIYFHDWNYQLKAESVPATIFEAILALLIQETLADELKNELPDVLENYELMAPRFFEAFSTDGSALFDDGTTPDRVENRDMIFDRAFLKAMRLLNKLRGPTMENWRWGAVHRGVYGIPLMREDSLLYRRYLKRESGPLEGGISTINRGGFLISKPFAADTATALSGIFDSEASYMGIAFGYSTNPFSEYYGNIRRLKISSMNAPAKHVLRIVPSK